MNQKVPTALPHQVEGTTFLRDRRAAALFDEQGLGKSKQLIDAIDQEIRAGTLDGAIVICPNILKTTWGQEIEQHSGLRYAIFGSGKSARRQAFRSLKASVYVINYEAVVSELSSLRALLRFKRFALVLDESHRIKTPNAKITRAVLALRTDAARRYIMTGTPVANKPDDLWSQLYFLDAGSSLGSTFDEFKERYKHSTGYVNVDELRDRVAGLSLRRRKEGTVQLPPKTVTRVSVALQGAQQRLYETLRKELAVWVQGLGGEQILAEAENILTRLVRLAQLTSNPRLIDAGYGEVPAKYAALDALLAAYLADPVRKVIVWTSFVDHIPELMGRYANYGPVAVYGDIDGDSRDKSVEAFKNDPAARVLIANPAAAREGLTLTVANVAIYLDRTFNLVDFLQSQDRIHRLSQREPCEIVLLIADSTIDEFIDYSLAQKQRLAEYTQRDSHSIAAIDLALTKPDLLRALIVP